MLQQLGGQGPVGGQRPDGEQFYLILSLQFRLNDSLIFVLFPFNDHLEPDVIYGPGRYSINASALFGTNL